MSGRVSVDDAVFDASAARLRSVKASLAGVKGQLNDGLAGGAPPAVAGAVRGAVASARGALDQASGNAGARAVELSRRAAWARVASGDAKASDLPKALAYLSGSVSRLSILPAAFIAKNIEPKDVLGGVNELVKRSAKLWNSQTFVRKKGLKDLGVSRMRAFLTRQGHWRNLNRSIASHSKAVRNLRWAARGAFWTSVALDAREVLTAKGSVKQNRAAGGVAGGLAGGMAGAKIGAGLGFAIGGPVGAVAGGAIGATIGAVAGGGLGKWVGSKIGKTGAGKAFGGAVNSVKGGAKKLWGKVF